MRLLSSKTIRNPMRMLVHLVPTRCQINLQSFQVVSRVVMIFSNQLLRLQPLLGVVMFLTALCGPLKVVGRGLATQSVAAIIVLTGLSASQLLPKPILSVLL